MNNDLHKNKWNMEIAQVNMEPPTIPLIKSKNDENSEKYCVKIKLRRYPTSQNSDLYELKMALFDNSEM